MSSYFIRRNTSRRNNALSIWAFELTAFGMSLGAALLAWGTVASHVVILPLPSEMVMSPQIAIVVYSVAYALLIVLAYRVRNGLYAGFHHVAMIGVFLTIGPIAALITAFAGRALSEVILNISYKRLNTRPHTLREAFFGSLYLAGAHTISIIIAGLFYRLSGGPLPLINFQPAAWLPLLFFWLINLAIYDLFSLIPTLSVSGEHFSFSVLPVLMFAATFSDLLSLLLSITFYQLPPAAFLMLLGGVLMAAALFRIAEYSRGNLQRRVVELATLNQIGQSLTSSLDMTSLLYSIYDQVSQLVEPHIFYIALYTPATE